MITYFECLPCFGRQALSTLKNIDPALHENVMRDVMHMLGDIDYSLSPPELAGEVFNVFRKHTALQDCYSVIKKHSNEYVLEIYDELKARIEASANPFDAAVKFAIAGNIIDFGANHDFSIESLHSEIDFALGINMNQEIILLHEEIEKAKKILYLGDNAGEIVFDKLLIEYLPAEKIIFAVRGEPVINDATIQDAVEIGLTEIVKVIDNGSNLPGTCLKACSDEFQQIFEESDLIISKGQGNYETLSDISKNIFFLLKIKCDVVARDLHGKLGDCICRNPERNDKF